MTPYPDFPMPVDEDQRLRDLQRHDLLDTPPDPHLQRLVKLAADVFQVPIALVSLVDQNRQWFLARYGLNATETPRQAAFCAHAVTQNSVLLVPDALQDDRFSNNPLVLGEPYIRFYAGAPLLSPDGHRLGTLCLIDRDSRPFDDHQQTMLQQMAELVMREIELRQQSLLCPVTHLFTRNSFFHLASIELEGARRNDIPLALLNLDIDNFNQVNNRWGHQAADQVLLDVCNSVKQHLRIEDLFGRIVDEELSVLFVNADECHSLALSESIRHDLEILPGIFDHSDYRPRISGGLVSFSPDDTEFADLFGRADQALSMAKGNGRNQIVRII
ncbi:MAG: GGDEF domain-containing protein [Vulcanococcus sp.]|jgi:diguanylate cyclase (GGDEF)-like protein|nr:sensor domain-containing diguanylate cyclase [Gammaproteobacteria bacterium]NCW09060.1 sensor domain-containing diguanylate cyclase [Gammaproteobacteria bacterium]